MKKILYIEANRDGTIGGSYYSLLYLVQSLNKEKYEPHVMFCQNHILIPEFKKVTPNVYINNFWPSASIPLRTFDDLIKWPYRFMVKIILKQFTLHKIITEIKPDLVHLNNGYSALHEWMLACYLHNINIVAHDRGTKYPCSLQTKLFVRCLDAIISVSDSYKNNVIRQKLKVKRIERVHNGIDIQQFKTNSQPELKDQLKQELNLEENQPIVGIIGNIDRWKGQHIVLQAIKRVKRQYPSIQCLIIGNVVMCAESYKEELDAYITNNGLEKNIIFAGFRKDIPNILNLLDVLIHASVEPEPFGRVILEGLALGKPIVATNGGGIPEIITHRETGLLVAMNDDEAMAEAILYYLANMEKANEIADRGKRMVRDLFSNEKTVRAIERIYEDIFNDQCKRKQESCHECGLE
jgi:glycosyltransferase involved in cell wall biosynthesis